MTSSCGYVHHLNMNKIVGKSSLEILWKRMIGSMRRSKWVSEWEKEIRKKGANNWERERDREKRKQNVIRLPDLYFIDKWKIAVPLSLFHCRFVVRRIKLVPVPSFNHIFFSLVLSSTFCSYFIGRTTLRILYGMIAHKMTKPHFIRSESECASVYIGFFEMVNWKYFLFLYSVCVRSHTQFQRLHKTRQQMRCASVELNFFFHLSWKWEGKNGK